MMKLIFNVYIVVHGAKKKYMALRTSRHIRYETFENVLLYEFDWQISQLGLILFEMTAAKSFMSLCWEPFMDKKCKELGL